jgi:hypothetical protein
MNARVVLSIAIAVVSVLAGSATQLDTLLGHGGATLVVAACNLATAVMAAVMGVLSTQSSQANRLAYDPDQLTALLKAMPGASNLTINSQATPQMAQAALSNVDNKISPSAGAEQALQKLAASMPVTAS